MKQLTDSINESLYKPISKLLNNKKDIVIFLPYPLDAKVQKYLEETLDNDGVPTEEGRMWRVKDGNEFMKKFG